MEHAKEGWLRKKGHDVGLWKWRFFRCEGGRLQYWKSRRGFLKSEAARGELPMRSLHAAASKGGCGCGTPSSDVSCRLLLRCADGVYDEELMAATLKDRDSWVVFLNRESLRERAAMRPISPESFLKAKGLWEPLLRRAADLAAAAGTRAAGEGEGAPAAGSAAGGAAADTSAAVTLVSHTMSGPALLRLSDRTSSPRQGPLVVTGRRLSRKRGAVPVTTVGQVLLLSGRALSAKKKWSGWACSPAAPQASTERPSAGAGAGAAPEAARLVEFEALHAFSHRLDTSGAIASLPLLRCSAGAVEECADGSGWRLRVSEDDCDEEVADAAGAPACSAGCQSAGASLQERNGWTLIFNSRDSCEEWQRAIRIACSAAKAQEAGRRRTHEEALAEYDADPEAWRRGALRRLTEAEQSAASASAPAGLRMVIRACDEAWSDARDLLDGALQQRPWHRDACEAVLEAALGPSGACAGRAWARWSGELSQNDGRTLLRWLDARRAAAHRMGVVYPALNAAIAGLSAELSLRTGEHLRRMSASLLGKELGVAARPRQAQLLGASSGASFTVPAASTLPVDLFALVCSCFPEAEDKEPVELLLSSRRVARFVIFEVQGALYRWLLETHQQIAEDVLGGRGPAAGSRERAKPLPPGVWAWLERVAALTRDIPGFQEQCTQWSARLSDAESSSSGMSRQPCADDRDELGRTALPLEWSLGPEAERFAELEGTLLWAACDVASLEWRRRALSETAAHGLKSLQDHLDGPLQGLRGMLEAAQFESLLRKLFHVCLAALVLRLSRRQCSQGATAMAVARQEAEYLCSYFQSQAARAVLAGAADAPPPPPPLEGGADLAEAGAPWGQPPWEFAMVAQVLQVVTESAMSSRRQSRSSGGSTPTGRITPGGPGTPGGAMDARSPGSAHAGAELRGGSLPSTQGLGQLVRVVQPERQLPLAELAAWFGDGPAGLRGCFEELPPSDGFGGAYLPPRAEDGPAGSRTPPRSPVQSMPPVIRSASWNSNDSRRRSSLISLFGRPSPRPSLLLESPRSGSPEPPGRLGPERGRALLASRGELCELRVEEAGAYGAFCCVGLRAPPAEGERGAPPTAPARLRRWAQLARAGHRSPPVFEVLECGPAGSGDQRAAPLVSHRLDALREAALRSTTELELTFARVRPAVLGESFTSGGHDVELRQYVVRFDCPSHLFRWRLVLEAWWQPPPGAAPLREHRPVVVLTSEAAPAEEACAPAGFPQDQLTCGVLEGRLGALWSSVRTKLQAAAQRS